VTPVEQRVRVAAAMSEDDLLTNTLALALARTLHWLTHHCRPAWTEKGWRTPVQGDRGFPDLILVRAGWLLAVELKRQRERLTTTQEEWRAGFEELTATPGSRVRYFVWRPSDLLDQTIRATLTDPSGGTP
jgi:hypothetical protein